MNSVRVLVTVPQLDGEKELLEEMRTVSPRVELAYMAGHTSEQVQQALDETLEVLYTRLLPNDLSAAPNLKWMQYHAAGADEVMLLADYLKERDIIVTNVSGAHAVPIGEYVIGTMVMLARGFVQLVRDKDQRVWDWSHGPENELRDKTLGIVGYGSLGREIGRLAHAFGMRILACKRNAEKQRDTGFQWPGIGDPEGVLPERIYPPSQLKQLLSQCDFVVSAVPYARGTAGMFGEAELRVMKLTAYLINISRGQVFDEPALIRALDEGWIAGAAIDTFTHGPLPADSRFWTLGDNVFISPHISGTVRNVHYSRRTNDIFVENLRRYMAGGKLINVVDLTLGY